MSFLERQRFLHILYDKLQSKDQIHTAKRVVAVKTDKHKAIVKTSDGAEYTGDLVVGADGVHSVVRSEIWRLSDEASQAPIAGRQGAGRL